MRLPFAFLSSASIGILSLLGAGTSATAQTTSAPPPTAPPANTASTTNNSGLAEIVVTASRREVNLQKESREITAISSQQLSRNGIADPVSVQTLAPGLTISTNGPQLQVSIRGVGDRTINAATDPAVAINVDGVYYPKSYEATGAFFDLDRIEVLKGPQGTLYGRNASSGAINLVTTRPTFQLGGFGEVEFGNFSDKRVTGALNLPLNDKVALRLSGQVIDRDGYLSDGYNDNKSKAARAQLLIAPDSDTSLLFSASYSHLGGKGAGTVIARRFGNTPTSSPVPDPSNPWAGPSDPETIARILATDPGDAVPTADGFQRINVYSLAATFEHHFSGATLTIIPAYVGSTISNLNYSALVVPTYQYDKSNQFSLETRLSSPSGSRFQWVIGGFGAFEDVKDQYQSEINPTFIIPVDSEKRNDHTAAAFGEANYSVTDKLRLIGGIRYTWERKDVVGATASVFGPITSFPVDYTTPVASMPGALDISGQRTDRAINYRAGVEYDIAPRIMLYASVATGFKAGGFYNDVAPNNSYKPEKLTAYTAGFKSRFLDNRLQVNIEGFYWDYKNKQESFLGTGSIPGSVILLTKNAASAKLYGADASLAAQVTKTIRLSGEVEYNHTKYGNYVVDTLTGPIDNSGEQLVRAPLWSGHVSYDQTIPLGDIGELDLNGQMRFSSSYWLTNDFVPIERQTSYRVFDASVTWVSSNHRYSVTGFVKNIGNQVYYTGGVYSPTSLADAVVGNIGDPRTYGVRARVAF